MLSTFPFIRWLSAFGLSPGQPVGPGFAFLPKVMLLQYNKSRRLKRLMYSQEKRFQDCEFWARRKR